MIAKLFNQPHVLWQTPDDGQDVPNDALAAYVDNGGSICVRQGDAEIVIGKATVPELCKLLKQLAAVQEK
jgi:hypothetical protein